MILGSLKGIWKSVVIFKLVPSFIRNWFYRLIARNRYKFFGKKEECLVPDGNIKDGFLDNSIFLKY